MWEEKPRASAHTVDCPARKELCRKGPGDLCGYQDERESALCPQDKESQQLPELY